MSPPIPTTTELSDSLVAAISASINQTIPILPKAFVRILAKALSAILLGAYKYGAFIFLQIFISTATFSEITVNGRKIKPLVFWGRLIGVGDPDPAVQAELVFDITVINQTGSLTGGEVSLIGSLNGVTYLLQTDVPLDAPVVQGTFRAVDDPFEGAGAGSQGNLSAGDLASFSTPLGDVAPDAVVASRPVDGVDAEGEEVYREKIEERFSGRPQGGADLDYVIWAKEVPGIIDVYPYTGDPGEIDVYNEATPASSGSPDGFPSAAQLLAIEVAIQKNISGLAFNRPLGSFINVFSITRFGVTVDITDLTGEDLPTLKANIDEALAIHLESREPFIDGVTPLPRKQNVTLDNVRGVVNDFAESANGTFTSVVVKFTISGVPISVYTLQEGEKTKLTIVNYLTTP